MKLILFMVLSAASLSFGLRPACASVECLEHFPGGLACDGQDGECIKNPDGSPGGFVANTAKAKWTRFYFSRNQSFHIDPSASVCDFAEVEDARLEAGARVSGFARILKGGVVQKNAQVNDHALVFGGGVVFASEVLGDFSIRDGVFPEVRLDPSQRFTRIKEEIEFMMNWLERAEPRSIQPQVLQQFREKVIRSQAYSFTIRLMRVFKRHGLGIQLSELKGSDDQPFLLQAFNSASLSIADWASVFRDFKFGYKEWEWTMNHVKPGLFLEIFEFSPFYFKNRAGWNFNEQAQFLLTLRDRYQITLTAQVFQTLAGVQTDLKDSDKPRSKVNRLSMELAGVALGYGLLGVEQDHQAALANLRDAEAVGSPLGRLILAVAHLRGDFGVPVDHVLAQQKFRLLQLHLTMPILRPISYFYFSQKLGRDFRLFNEDKDECEVCYEEFSDEQKLTLLKCGHFFHQDCAHGWFNFKRTCPLCKQHNHLIN